MGGPLFPPEAPLPAKAKDTKWLRVLASCIVVSSNGVQYSLSQFMPHVSSRLGQKAMASAISLLICFFTLGWILQVSFALTGFGIGPSFLSAIIHLQFWLPKSPALASSIAMAFGGLGSVLMALMIEWSIEAYGVSASFAALA